MFDWIRNIKEKLMFPEQEQPQAPKVEQPQIPEAEEEQVESKELSNFDKAKKEHMTPEK